MHSEPPKGVALLETSREELIQLTRDLIALPSVAPQEHLAADFIAQHLRQAGIDVTLSEAAPGRPNVLAVLQGAQGPGRTLLFEGHLDVVTAGDPERWSHPPFEPALVGSRLYGRGSADTKGNVAAALLTLLALKRAGAPFKGTLMVLCPVDEEGLMLGIKHFIRSGLAKGIDGAMICEPEENMLCIAQKGALRFEAVFEGTMAHGAMPLTGLNPVPMAARFIGLLGAMERQEIERHGRHALLDYPSISPTATSAPAQGEGQLNVVPEDVRVAIDVRTVPGQDHKDLSSRMQALLDEALAEAQADLIDGLGHRLRSSLRPGMAEALHIGAHLTALDDRPWTETPLSEPLVQAAEAAVRQVTGQQPQFAGVPGATDGTFLHALAGIPIVTTGAGDRFVPHHRDEWVDVDELWQTAQIYYRTALGFFALI